MALTQICCTCKQDLEFSFFSKSKNAKHGYDRVCKVCKHIDYIKNKEHRKARASKWKQDNPEKRLENNRRWVVLNQEKARKCSRDWAARNRDYGAYARAKRRAAELQATPKWANLFFIEEIYSLSRLRTNLTGIKWHVDHIIPLRGKTVCGLHVESNLTIIPAIDNLRKGNRFGAVNF